MFKEIVCEVIKVKQGRFLFGFSCALGDYVKVFPHLEAAAVNELTAWAALLCGNLSSVPRTVYSSGPALVLAFHSAPTSPHNNATRLHTGFEGTFRFLDRSKFKQY